MTSIADIAAALARAEEVLGQSTRRFDRIVADVESEFEAIARLVDGSSSSLPEEVKGARAAIRREAHKAHGSRKRVIDGISEYRAKLCGDAGAPGTEMRATATMAVGREAARHLGEGTLEKAGEEARSVAVSCRWLTDINDQDPPFAKITGSQVAGASIDIIESALTGMAAQTLGPVIHRQAKQLSKAIAVRAIQQPQARTTGLLRGPGRAAAWLVEDPGRSEVAAEIALMCTKHVAFALTTGFVGVLPLAFDLARPGVKRTLATLATRTGASQAMAPWIASFGTGLLLPEAPGALRTVIEHGIPSSIGEVVRVVSPAVRRALELVDKTLVPI